MIGNENPFSVREGFAPQMLHMSNLETLHKIWGAAHGLVAFEDALQVLQEVFAVSASGIHKARRSYQQYGQQLRSNPMFDLVYTCEQARRSEAEHQANALDGTRQVVEEKWTRAHKNGEWFKFYDMCEFLIANGSRGREIAAAIQRALDKMGNPGCRLMDGKFVPDFSREEAEEVRMACARAFTGARMHMKNAVAAFADRERPDYAHTVKEAISAVESLVKELTGKEEVRSGLRQLAKDGILPKDRDPKGKAPFLVEALDRYWAYANKTSRHGLKSGESPPDAGTARFLLVTCAAFVNYMTARKSRESDSA